MKKFMVAALLPVLIGGCVPVIPFPISVASSGLNGFYLLTTGKSTTDHVISAAMDQDCAIHRIAIGGKVCQNYNSERRRPKTEYTVHFPGDLEEWADIVDTPELADVERVVDPNMAESPEAAESIEETVPEVPVDQVLVSSLSAPIRPVSGVSMNVGLFKKALGDEAYLKSETSWLPPLGPIAVEQKPLSALPEPRPATSASLVASDNVADLAAKDRFVALGSFRSVDRAGQLLNRFSHLKPKVMLVSVAGQTWNRVAVGPLSKRDARILRDRYDRIDGHTTWSFIKK